MLAEYLMRLGVECVVFRPAGSSLNGLSSPFYRRVTLSNVSYFSGPFELLRALRSVDYVYSFSAVLPMWLGKYRFLYPFLQHAGWPKFATIGTGSNLTEAIQGNSLHAVLARIAMRFAHINIVNNYPHAVKNLVRYRTGNVVFLPFPFVHVDEDFSIESGAGAATQAPEDQIVLFHPSHIDWGGTDAKQSRNSTKGSDRFFRAFARFAARHKESVRLVILDRGPDRELAKELLSSLGVADLASWHRELTRDEFLSAVKSADIVVDQFDVGGLGGIAWEAMSLGKPVLMYIDKETNELAYWGEAPVINASSENEIFDALESFLNKEKLENMGEAGRSWVSRHSWDSLARKYLVYAELATGINHFNYGVFPLGSEK